MGGNLERMSGASLSLTKSKPADLTVFDWDEGGRGYPLEVTAVGTGMPSDIFVLQMSGSGYDPAQGDFFIKVADALDLSDIPDKTSIPTVSDNGYPFYRTDTIKLWCRSIDIYNDVWDIIQKDASELVNSLNIDTTSNTEVITII